MGKRSRDKGARSELKIVHLLQGHGFAAEKTPLSGAVKGKFGGDISMPLLGTDRKIEVKCRADGFRELYKWLQDAEFLIVHADRKPPLVVLPLRFAIEIASVAEKNR